MRTGRTRSDTGVVFPSPVVMLSIIAVAMAAIAFVATRSDPPTEREVTTVARPEAVPSQALPTGPTAKPTPIKPAVKRGEIYVEVYNNSNITGLAGRVAQRTTGAGWKVVGSDNWIGTIPTTTVYHPKRLKEAAELLALDLGIQRTALAVDPMRLDRLTLILTGELS
ncbi:MAG: LytR C-terminal domain-containing protein [Nocardioides sp.]